MERKSLYAAFNHLAAVNVAAVNVAAVCVRFEFSVNRFVASVPRDDCKIW